MGRAAGAPRVEGDVAAELEQVRLPLDEDRLVVAPEEVADPTVAAISLGCASQQDSWKGARRGREEASKVACPDREEGASKAQATEEDLARQVDKCSRRGSFPAP